MPELLEVEIYRRFAEQTVGRTITSVHAPDDWFLKNTTAGEVTGLLAGLQVLGTRRIGKLLLLELGEKASVEINLGLRFGMTGRLLVDDEAAIDQLEYSSDRNDPAWDRFGLNFDHGFMVLRDPRRLGGIELDPDTTKLGPDAWGISADDLAGALAKGRGPLKARLLDQKRIAGLGNLLVDEVLWRSGLSPHRVSGELDASECLHLATVIGVVLDELDAKGGSHQGDLHDRRARESTCPDDDAPLMRETIGGRTTYWCPLHQK